jgi:hypothetical protein
MPIDPAGGGARRRSHIERIEAKASRSSLGAIGICSRPAGSRSRKSIFGVLYRPPASRNSGKVFLR